MRLLEEERINKVITLAIKELISENIGDDVLGVLTDTNLYNHSLGVARYVVGLGIAYEKNDKFLIKMAKGAILHDVGKLFIDRDVLYKPNRLTDSEFALVKQHTVLGYKHISEKTDNKFILEAVRHHHEKLNGQGYPDGIEVDNRTLQIITVADIFSALTEARVYKRAYSASEAFKILESDDSINQEVVKILKGIVIDEYAAYFARIGWVEYFRLYFSYEHVYSFEFD